MQQGADALDNWSRRAAVTSSSLAIGCCLDRLRRTGIPGPGPPWTAMAEFEMPSKISVAIAACRPLAAASKRLPSANVC